MDEINSLILDNDTQDSSQAVNLKNTDIKNQEISTEKRLQTLTNELEKSIKDNTDTKNLVIVGFFVLLIMVATMLISVFMVFIQSSKDSKESNYPKYEYYSK